MKYFALLFALVLSGCGMFQKQPIAVERKFPDATPALMKKCEELKTIPAGDRVAITDMLKTVIENYQLYYTCSNKVDGWQEWYIEQRKIFDSVK
jgi:hypothetical protein